MRHNTGEWYAKAEWRWANEAFKAFIPEMENPTCAQVEKVIECMRDSVKDFCVCANQKQSSEKKSPGQTGDPVLDGIEKGVISAFAALRKPIHDTAEESQPTQERKFW